MAVFNPELPNTNDPNYTRESHPIGGVPADTSASIAISGAADILGSGVKAIDTDIKKSAQLDVQSGIDKLRDATTDQLQTLRNVQIGQQQASLLPDDSAQANPPQSLQNGLARINTLGTAMAQNGGKTNDTLYTGALVATAKQLRAQYPGYRDYIDEQIKSISGIDPANAYMKNLMEDINHSQENAKAEHNATLSTLRENANQGYHDASGTKASDVYTLVSKGLWAPDKGIAWLNESKKLDYDRKTANDARADRNANDADAAVTAQKDLSTLVMKNNAHDWSTMTKAKGTDTAEGLFKFIQAHSGDDKVMDEQSQAIGQQLVNLRNASYNSRMAEAAEGGKNSILAHMGGDISKVKAQLDASFATFDTAIQQVFAKDWGQAYSHMNFNKAIAADTTNMMNNAPDEASRRYNRVVQDLNTRSPQFAKDFFQGMLLSDVPRREMEWLKTQKMDLLVQPDAGQGKLSTFQGAIDASKAAGMTSPKSYTELTKTIDSISDPKLDIKQRLNLAKSFFDPDANGQILSDKNFKKDQYDPTLKRDIPGKYSVYRRLTSDNVAAGVAELGKTDPTVVANYRATISKNFGEQLFSRELKDLGNANVNENTNTPANFKIKFTDDKGSTPHFEAVRPDGSPMTMNQAAVYGAPVGSINRLNEGMTGLYNAYSKTGSNDPSNDVLKEIYRYNYQDATSKSPQAYNKIGDLPRMIWDSIQSANNSRLKEAGDIFSGKK